jgi:hypothetical protein
VVQPALVVVEALQFARAALHVGMLERLRFVPALLLEALVVGYPYLLALLIVVLVEL